MAEVALFVRKAIWKEILKKFLMKNKFYITINIGIRVYLTSKVWIFIYRNIKLQLNAKENNILSLIFFKSKGIEFAEEHLRYIQGLDERKRQICGENDIILIYYLDKKFNKYIGNDILKCNSEKELLKIMEKIEKEKDGATGSENN